MCGNVDWINGVVGGKKGVMEMENSGGGGGIKIAVDRATILGVGRGGGIDMGIGWKVEIGVGDFCGWKIKGMICLKCVSWKKGMIKLKNIGGNNNGYSNGLVERSWFKNGRIFWIMV